MFKYRAQTDTMRTLFEVLFQRKRKNNEWKENLLEVLVFVEQKNHFRSLHF